MRNSLRLVYVFRVLFFTLLRHFISLHFYNESLIRSAVSVPTGGIGPMLFCPACGKFIWRRRPHCRHCRGARQVVPRLLLLLMVSLLVVGFVVNWLGVPANENRPIFVKSER